MKSTLNDWEIILIQNKQPITNDKIILRITYKLIKCPDKGTDYYINMYLYQQK